MATTALNLNDSQTSALLNAVSEAIGNARHEMIEANGGFDVERTWVASEKLMELHEIEKVLVTSVIQK